jgi:hypothetical protein
MNIVNDMKKSINTSLKLNLFETNELAITAHIFHSELMRFSIENIKTELINFDQNITNTNDVSLVGYYQNRIKTNKEINPIWIINYKNKFYLLEGRHKIIASINENRQTIATYLIEHK